MYLGIYKFRTVKFEVFSDVMNVECAKELFKLGNLFPVFYQYSIIEYIHFVRIVYLFIFSHKLSYSHVLLLLFHLSYFYYVCIITVSHAYQGSVNE